MRNVYYSATEGKGMKGIASEERENVLNVVQRVGMISDH